KPLKMFHVWPVRTPRPITQKLPSSVPLITGQRIFDTFVPIAKGGTGAIPGAFGTGKTVMQHQLAKWSDAKVVVYVGCGERGNEMAEVLLEFPQLEDPRSGEPLMNRTILIANTSNMPVAAREASVYTGITLAEYYRDQGYDVALMADSTSRWAEAIREVSGRLEEMPGEEGYPAYLGSKVAEFYERTGRVQTLGAAERIGSITVIGAVSPPGGDFSEPVTQNTLRVVKVFYALSKDLASRRHFPAIDWLTSYSLYLEDLEPWFVENIASDFISLRRESMAILQKEKELQEIVQLVGPDALPESERIVLEAARMLREDYLMQNSYSEDSFCPLDKQYKMLNAILMFYHKMQELQDQGILVRDLTGIPLYDKVSRMKWYLGEEFEQRREEIMKDIQELSPEMLAKKWVST
ncbi:MAG: V-type ATP synthase subunit A, partial [Candidatus Hodarchaeota archaeon]